MERFEIPETLATALDEHTLEYAHQVAEVYNDEASKIQLTFSPISRQGRDLTFTAARLNSSLSRKERSFLFIFTVLAALKKIDDPTFDRIAGGILCKGGDCELVQAPPDFPCPDKETFKEFLKHAEAAGVILANSSALDEAAAVILRIRGEPDADASSRAIRTILNQVLSRGQTWFSQDDVSVSRNFSFTSSPSAVPVGLLSGKKLFYEGEKSLVTIAPPGAGKTQGHVLPALAAFEGSIVVLDIKGECFEKTRHLRPGRVLRYAPFSPRQSHKYNPLDFVSRDTLEVFRDARILATSLVRPDPRGEQHWDNRARDQLAAIIAFVVTEEDEKSMRTVMEWISADVDSFTIMAETMATSEIHGMRSAGKAFLSQIERMPKMLESYLETMRGHLSVWEEDSLLSISDVSDWEPSELREDPVTIYLTVPLAAVESYASALRVIIAQHINALCPYDDTEPAKIKTLLLLDELPRLGRMEPVQQAIDVGRGYGVRTWMFAQYIGQLYQAYGNSTADGMIAACGVRAFMDIGEDHAQALSKAIGKQESILDEKTKPLVEPYALTGPEWRDNILMLSQGEYPARLDKAFFHSENEKGES